MEPTFKSGDVLICVDAWNVKPGDVVTFIPPDDERDKWPKEDWLWCKRIDHINDEREFWLVGDNTEESYDSRNFGYVPWSNIYKKVVFALNTGK